MGWSIGPAKAARLPGLPDIGDCGMPSALPLGLSRRKAFPEGAPAWCIVPVPGVQLPVGVKLRDLHSIDMAAVTPVAMPCFGTSAHDLQRALEHATCWKMSAFPQVLSHCANLLQ